MKYKQACKHALFESVQK